MPLNANPNPTGVEVCILMLSWNFRNCCPEDRVVYFCAVNPVSRLVLATLEVPLPVDKESRL